MEKQYLMLAIHRKVWRKLYFRILSHACILNWNCSDHFYVRLGGLIKEDFDASVATLQSIADSLEASMTQLRVRGTDKLTAQYLIRQRAPEQDFTEIR